MQGGNRQPKIVAQRGRYNVSGKTEQQLEPRPDNISNTLTAVQKDNMVLDNVCIRRLTPIECERLQGFPDNWTAHGTDGTISDTLGGIALKNGWYSGVRGLFGDSGYAQALADKNGIVNRGLIYPGAVITKE